MSKRSAYLLTQLGIIILWVLLTTVIMYLGSGVRVSGLFDAFFFVLLFVGFTHIFRFTVIKLNFFEFSTLRLISLGIICCIALASLLYPLASMPSLIMGTQNFKEIVNPTNALIQVLANSLLFLLWSTFYFLYHFFTSYQNSLKWEAFRNEAELNHLKNQLNPHFLFNSLNCVRALIDENPEKAKESVTQLSQLLRSSLETGKKKLITLEEELETVKDYLSLERIRFEERLDIELQCPKSTLGAKVPPLMVQTLVENGIKHGISKLKEGGRISIRSHFEPEGVLRLEIKNSGEWEYDKKGKRRKGIGLANSRKRLNLLFQGRANLDILNGTNKEVVTILTIPQN